MKIFIFSISIIVIVTLVIAIYGQSSNSSAAVNGIKPQQFFGPGDIRIYGAICNGTDQNTAVIAALNAGLTSLYIPAGCTWKLPTSDWTYNPGSGTITVSANGIP